MRIHAASLAAGGGIAAAAIVAAFFILSPAQNELELRDAPAGELTLSVLLDNASPPLGSEDAPVTLVEFGDYQCFYCNRFYHDTEAKLVENYVDTGKVRLLFKDMTIIGEDSVSAAIGAQCAADQGRFWEYHDALYDNWGGENNGWASPANLKKFAGQAGLEEAQWSSCLESRAHAGKVEASLDDARALGLTGTPAFFLIGPDGKVTALRGAQPYEAFERAIDAALQA